MVCHRINIRNLDTRKISPGMEFIELWSNRVNYSFYGKEHSSFKSFVKIRKLWNFGLSLPCVCVDLKYTATVTMEFDVRVYDVLILFIAYIEERSPRDLK